MTAKEKAQQLIENSKDYVHGYIGSSFMTNYKYPEQILSQAKKIAIMIADEIIDEITNNMELDWMQIRKDGENTVEYWVNVKKQVNDS